MSTIATVTGAYINKAIADTPKMSGGVPRIVWFPVPDTFDFQDSDEPDTYITSWLNPRKALTKKRITDIACFGDSLTNGYGAGSSSLAYYSVLSSLYGGERAVFNGGYNAGTSTVIRQTFDANPDQHTATCVIWAGNNNVHNDAGTEQSKIDVAAMIAALPHTRFLVLGNVCGDWGADYYLGGSVHTRVLALNKYWADLYGPKFFDVFTYLACLYKPSLTGDVTDFEHRIIPRSLRVDEIHLSATGYHLVAKAVYRVLKSLYP